MVDSARILMIFEVLLIFFFKSQNKINAITQQAKIKVFSSILQIEKFILVIFEYLII